MTKVGLFNTLGNLNKEEFEQFKWCLQQPDLLEGYKSIQESKLENAGRRDTVDLMVKTYQLQGAQKVTKKILEEIDRNDLVQSLPDTSSGPEVMAAQDTLVKQMKKQLPESELKRVQQYAVDVTLDPDTAHPYLILSDDGKQVNHSDVRKNRPANPERYSDCVCVLGKQSFSSGRFHFEVQVKGKTDWSLGVARESIERKGKFTLNPQNGYWTIWLRNGNEYKALDNPRVHLSLKSPPQKVGVFVDYEEGLVSFYDVDAAALIYSFTGCSFTEKLFPYFCPWKNDGGKNSAPLIISPVRGN